LPEGEAVALAWIASAIKDPTIPANNVLLSSIPLAALE